MGRPDLRFTFGTFMAFSNLIGQEHAVRILQKALASARLAHAYLFYGPHGTGKKLAALQFVKALSCISRSTDACETCSACHKITTGNHPDVTLCSPEGHAIRIDHVRAIQHQLSYKPYENPYTTIIIDGCEFLTPPAANALLKTLEEPPASAILLLLAGKKNALPLTITSRCQLIPFRPLSPAHIRTILEQQGVEPATATILAPLAEGRLEILHAADYTRILARRHSAYTLLQEASQAKGTSFFLQARQLASKRENCEEFLRWLSLLCRDVVVLQVAPTTELYNPDLLAELSVMAHQLTTASLLDTCSVIDQLREYLHMNINPQLIFERLLIQLQQAFGAPHQHELA